MLTVEVRLRVGFEEIHDIALDIAISRTLSCERDVVRKALIVLEWVEYRAVDEAFAYCLAHLPLVVQLLRKSKAGRGEWELVPFCGKQCFVLDAILEPLVLDDRALVEAPAEGVLDCEVSALVHFRGCVVLKRGAG